MVLLAEYVRAVFGRVILLLAGVLGVALTVVSLAIPGITRIAGLALIVLAVLSGQFLAWRDMRRERDQVQVEAEAFRGKLATRSLAFDSVEIGNFIGNPMTKSAVQVGVRLHNFGPSLIHYTMLSLSVVLEGKTVENPNLANSGGDIPPGRVGAFYFPAIQELDITKPLDGTIEFTLEYGHPEATPVRTMYRRLAISLLTLEGSTYIDHPHWTVLAESDSAPG